MQWLIQHAYSMQRYAGEPNGLGACRGAAACPASSPDGMVSSKEGWGEPTRCARPASRSIYTIMAAIPTAVCYASLVATLHGYREAYRVPTPYAIALYGLHAAPLQHYSVGCITGTLLRACHVESVCVYHSMHTERAHAERAYGYYVVATDTLRDATPYGVLPHPLLPDYAMAGELQRVDS